MARMAALLRLLLCSLPLSLTSDWRGSRLGGRLWLVPLHMFKGAGGVQGVMALCAAELMDCPSLLLAIVLATAKEAGKRRVYAPLTIGRCSWECTWHSMEKRRSGHTTSHGDRGSSLHPGQARAQKAPCSSDLFLQIHGICSRCSKI